MRRSLAILAFAWAGFVASCEDSGGDGDNSQLDADLQADARAPDAQGDDGGPMEPDAQEEPDAGDDPADSGGEGPDAATPEVDADLPDGASGPEGGTDADAALDGSADSAVADANAGEGGTIPEVCTALSATGELLLDLGNAWISRLYRGDTRVLAADQLDWALWDPSTGARVARGYDWSGAQLAGNTVLLVDSGTLELRDAADGELIAAVAIPGHGGPSDVIDYDHQNDWVAGLSTDGSYAWARSRSWLRAYRRDGTPLLDVSGDHFDDDIFATPSELLVNRRATSVITTYAMPSGTPTTSPAYLGTFTAWFADGSRFITKGAGLSRIYSTAAALQQATTQDVRGGLGGYFYVARLSPTRTDVYALGGTTPIGTVTGTVEPMASRNVLTTIDQTGINFHTLQSSGVSSEHVDVDGAVGPLAMAANGGWSVAGRWTGTFFDSASVDANEQRVLLGCGRLTGFTGSPSGRFAIATTRGIVTYYNANTRELEGIVDFGGRAASQLRLSDDGATLALLRDERTVLAYALPQGTLLHSWPDSTAVDLARDGSRIARVDCASSSCSAKVSDLAGGNEYDTVDPLTYETTYLALSPNGARLAVPVSGQAALLYQGGQPIGSASGGLQGWLDNDRLLFKGASAYGWILYDHLGTELSSLTMPGLDAPWRERTVLPDATSIFAGGDSALYSLTDGHLVWRASPTADRGIIAGDYVIYTTPSEGSTLRIAELP